MIPESMRDTVPAYVLGDLSAAERVEFERVMMQSPQLQHEVLQCAETLGVLAARAAPRQQPPAHLWDSIEARVCRESRDTTRAALAGGVVVTPRRSVWTTWFWPAAAALLLLANLAQWAGRPRGVDPLHGVSHAGAAGAQVELDQRPGSGDPMRSVRDSLVERGADAGTLGAADRTMVEGQPSARERFLADEYRRLAGEYDGLVDLLAPLVASGALHLGQHGVWTLEMAPRLGAASGAAQGFWSRVRDLVPDQGVALLPDRWRMPGGVALDPSTWFAGRGNTVGGVTAGGSSVDLNATPYALAVIRGEEGLGYLDLYNLPQVPAGQELRLWLQGADDVGYTSVGVVPPILAGGSAGVVFRVPPTMVSARRVLITLEPGPGVRQPSGPVVIEGP